jgi:Protein of unknown function (DUF3306)
MSEPEKFLQDFLERWSRRKLAAAERAAGGAPSEKTRELESAEASPSAAAAPESAPPAFDPVSLPPIESITAASDVRAFLAPGVPIELTRAALRRAWVSDPAIRDFIGIAENQWDFTKPDGVPGFGTLDLTPELRRVLAGVTDDARADGAPARPACLAAATETREKSSEMAALDDAAGSAADAPAPSAGGKPQIIAQSRDRDAAAQDDGIDRVPEKSPAHCKHGGALPT